MVKIKNRKIRKFNEQYYISIPKALIDSEVLFIDNYYTIELVKSKRNTSEIELLEKDNL